jgi:hypothetical protein
MTVAKEISKYKIDLVGVQEDRWDRGGTEPASEFTFFNGKGNENNELGTGFFIYVGKSISELQMDIELKQIRVLILKMLLFLNIISLYIEALVPSFHKPLKTSSIKFYGLLSETGSSAGCFHCIDAHFVSGW